MTRGVVNLGPLKLGVAWQRRPLGFSVTFWSWRSVARLAERPQKR